MTKYYNLQIDLENSVNDFFRMATQSGNPLIHDYSAEWEVYDESGHKIKFCVKPQNLLIS